MATPRLVETFKFANAVTNELAYNPPGSEEGFLFWNSWAAHNAATVFGTQDAHGPVRRGLLVVSCDALSVLDQIKETTPSLKVLIELLNAPRQSAVCPSQVPDGDSHGQGDTKPRQDPRDDRRSRCPASRSCSTCG